MSDSRPTHHLAKAPTLPAALSAAVSVAVQRGSLPAGSCARRWRSTELFGPELEIEIEHGQAVYRLRQTSLGKLILTK
jgi:hemin uptake protein HemP